MGRHRKVACDPMPLWKNVFLKHVFRQQVESEAEKFPAGALTKPVQRNRLRRIETTAIIGAALSP